MIGIVISLFSSFAYIFYTKRTLYSGGVLMTTNIGQSLTNILKTVIDDEPKNPLHVGEVMNLWTYLTMLEEANRFSEIGLNTTTDDELINAIKYSWHDCDKQISDVKKLFKEEGVSLPP